MRCPMRQAVIILSLKGRELLKFLFYSVFFSLFASALFANNFICEGHNPFWNLSLSEESIEFSRVGEAVQNYSIDTMSIAQGSNHQSKLAFVAIAQQTAPLVLIFDDANCVLAEKSLPYRLHILTNENREAIFLTGCCHQGG